VRKWIPAVLILAAFAFGAAVMGRLPEQVSPRFDAFIPWIASGSAKPMSRVAAVIVFPAVALLAWLILRFVGSRSRGVERFGHTYDGIVAGVVGFLVLFHVATIGTVLGWSWSASAFGVMVGLGLIALGNIMPRTRPNWVAGIRTSTTVNNPDIWRATHRWFGALLVASGLVVVLLAFTVAQFALFAAVVGLILSGIIASVAGARGATTPTVTAP